MIKGSNNLGPSLETDRLILRPPITEDFAGFCAFEGDSEATKFMGGVHSPPVVWRAMRAVAGGWALDGFHFFSVIEKKSGAWIGRVGPICPHGWPGREVGWGLLRNHWGKGYAREAAKAAMNFAFENLGWDQIIHSIHPDNIRSAAVAAALGSRKIGPGRMAEPYADVPIEIWGQSRDEWRAQVSCR